MLEEFITLTDSSVIMYAATVIAISRRDLPDMYVRTSLRVLTDSA